MTETNARMATRPHDGYLLGWRDDRDAVRADQVLVSLVDHAGVVQTILTHSVTKGLPHAA